MHKDTLEAFTQELLDYELGASLLNAEKLAIAQEFWTRGIRFSMPVDMVLFCPSCGVQHIDAPVPCPDEGCPHYGTPHSHPDSWTNPAHRSHLCGACGHIWRPADVPTNGVKYVATRGQNDSPIPVERATIADYMEVLADKALLTRELDVLLNGEAGAAKQAAFCDIVGQVRIDAAELRAALVNYYPDCMPSHGSVIKWARDAIESELSTVTRPSNFVPPVEPGKSYTVIGIQVFVGWVRTVGDDIEFDHGHACPPGDGWKRAYA